MSRVAVHKTYKLFVGGAFPRSESGRSFVVHDHEGGFWANAALASRKDARDAVTAARAAFPGWSGRTAYNRAQVVYRIAEVAESRRTQLEADLRTALGLDAERAAERVDRALDRLVWYAGWADKLGQVVGGANPVAGPFLNLSTPEPAGVTALLAPDDPLLGLVSVLAPAIVMGGTAVVVASEPHPLPAITLAEVMATADVPAGVVNVLTGHRAELAPVLAAHGDVDALDLSGVTDPDLARELEVAAADNLKRVRRPAPPEAPEDLDATPDLSRLTDLVEIKTVWHPRGL